MADQIKFIRRNGRIIPIRMSKREKNLAAGSAASAAGALAGAYAVGRTAPPGGMSEAPARVKRTLKFQVTRGFGVGTLAASALAGSLAGKAISRHVGDGNATAVEVAVGAGLAALLPGVARLGKLHQLAYNVRKASARGHRLAYRLFGK